MGNIFITGATGQVGHELVNYLLESQKLNINNPQEIICLVRTPAKAKHLLNRGCSLVKGSLRDQPIIYETFQKFQPKFVFHLAANIYVYASYTEMMEDNYYGTRNVLDAFVQSDAQTFVYSSSIVVYDHKNITGNHTHFTEEDALGSAKMGMDRPYTISKRKTEKLIHDYQQRYPEKDFIIARISPIIGFHDRQMIPTIIASYKIPVPKLIDKGSGKLSLTSSKDCARAMVFLAERSAQIKGQIFNVAHDMLNFSEIFSIFAAYYHRPRPFISIPKKLFLWLIPPINWLRKVTPHNKLLQTILSESTMDYLTHSYFYDSTKLQNLGFQYLDEIKTIFLESLDYINRKMNLLEN